MNDLHERLEVKVSIEPSAGEAQGRLTPFQKQCGEADDLSCKIS